jgi:hypothetical protein
VIADPGTGAEQTQGPEAADPTQIRTSPGPASLDLDDAARHYQAMPLSSDAAIKGYHHQGGDELFAEMAPNSPSASLLIPSEK